MTLYLQDDAGLLKAAAPTADVISALHAGDEVTWQKADAPKKGWFKVAHGTESGFVQRASLATEKPNFDASSKASTISEGNRGISSSGAANKAVSQEAKDYGNAKGLGNEVGQLEKLEGVAVKVDDTATQAHARKAGLTAPVTSKGGK